MRIIGYCTECRRFRPVLVSSSGMAMLAAKGVAQGVCVSCETKKRERRQQKRRDGN